MSSQTRSMSLVESIANTGAGFLVSLVLQISLFYFMSIETTTSQNLLMSGVFTVASLVRGYVMRRVFVWWQSGTTII
jgi:putative flippase GtrA